MGLFLERSQRDMAHLDVVAREVVDKKLGMIPTFSVKSQKIVSSFYFACSELFLPSISDHLRYIISKYTELQ